MGNKKNKRKKGKFNVHRLTHKYKKALVGAISLLMVLSMLAGVLADFLI